MAETASADARHKDEWQYWQAITLMNEGKKQKVKPFYANSSRAEASTQWWQHKIKHGIPSVY